MKTYQVLCPDCGGVLTEGTNYRALLGKEHTCDGPHDEDVKFIVSGKDVMLKRDKLVFNKLVRDKIPEIIKKDGFGFKIHIAKDDKEYKYHLFRKLIEEATEFQLNPCAEEIADILEVIEAYARIEGIGLDEIKQKKLEKRKERGSFTKRIILEHTKEKELILTRDGSHVHLNMGNTKKLRSDFKTSGTK